MDRAPNLQDVTNETRDKPEPQGTGIDYKEIAREVLARIDQRLADLEADTPPDPSEAQFQAETASSLMTSHDQTAFVRWVWRGLFGLLLSASLVAAISFLWSHGEAAMESVARGGAPDRSRFNDTGREAGARPACHGKGDGGRRARASRASAWEHVGL